MATPMTAAQWRTAMEKWGVKTFYRDGWETHGRPNRPWGGVNGIMVHHTGSDTNTASYVNALFAEKGMRYPSLPGPLCHASTGPDGTTTIGATRRANHAGAGTSRTFARVVAEDYKGYESELSPGGNGGVDGNTRFYGNEVRFSGAHTMTEAQYAGVVRWCAAICDFHGWSALSIIGHREWTSAKPDPGKTSMAQLRRDVRDLLAVGPNPEPTPEPEPTPDPEPAPDPKPDPYKPSHKRWFKISLVNHAAASAGLARPGAMVKWLKRRKRLVNINIGNGGVNPDAICGLECGGGVAWHYISTKYKKAGYKLAPGGKSGRNIWLKTNRIVASGAFDPPRYKGDDKPAPWVVADLDGTLGMVVLSHLEWRNGDTPELQAKLDTLRVTQQQTVIDQAREVAAKYGIGPARIVFAGDTASDNWVREKAFMASGYRDAFDVAYKAVNADVKSYNEYDPPQPGARVDIIAVYFGDGPGRGETYARPVEVVSQRLDSVATDHNVMAAVINRQ